MYLLANSHVNDRKLFSATGHTSTSILRNVNYQIVYNMYSIFLILRIIVKSLFRYNS